MYVIPDDCQLLVNFGREINKHEMSDLLIKRGKLNILKEQINAILFDK